MPKDENWHKVKGYPGVYYRIVPARSGAGTERHYYIRYRRGGRGENPIKEPLGRASEGWTPARASVERAARMVGKKMTNREQRETREKASIFGRGRLTRRALWEGYDRSKPERKTRLTETNTLIPKIGSLLDRDAVSLTTADITALRLRLTKTKSGATWRKDQLLAPKTIKEVLALVRRVINFGVKMGALSMPAVLVFDFPKVDNLKTETMTEDQRRRYWQALNEEPEQDAAAFLKLVFLTGIRRGAALALRWSDVDLDRGLLTMRGENAKNGRTEFIPFSNSYC